MICAGGWWAAVQISTDSSASAPLVLWLAGGQRLMAVHSTGQQRAPQGIPRQGSVAVQCNSATRLRVCVIERQRGKLRGPFGLVDVICSPLHSKSQQHAAQQISTTDRGSCGAIRVPHLERAAQGNMRCCGFYKCMVLDSLLARADTPPGTPLEAVSSFDQAQASSKAGTIHAVRPALCCVICCRANP